MKLIQKIKQDHLLMMIICCGLPIILGLIAVYFLGLSKNYLFWIFLIICPLSHYFMMKYMHKDNKNKGSKCH